MPSSSRSKLRYLLILVTFAITLADAQENKTLPVGAQDTVERIAPPAGLVCDRNQLTSYNGIVSVYSRSPESISITISTDWGTEESVAIQQEEGEFEPYFLLFSRPFSEEEWSLIEEKPGKLLPNVRATAWICLDGVTLPVIDWQPGYSSPGRSRRQP